MCVCMCKRESVCVVSEERVCACNGILGSPSTFEDSQLYVMLNVIQNVFIEVVCASNGLIWKDRWLIVSPPRYVCCVHTVHGNIMCL